MECKDAKDTVATITQWNTSSLPAACQLVKSRAVGEGSIVHPGLESKVSDEILFKMEVSAEAKEVHSTCELEETPIDKIKPLPL